MFSIVGLLSSNSFHNTVFGLEDKINEEIDKAIGKVCPSSSSSSPLVDNSKGIKDKISNIIESCLSGGTTNPPPPNDNTAVLVTKSILRANNCNWFIPPCPTPNGEIGIFDLTANQFIAGYSPSENNNDPVDFFNAIPVGHQIKISASVDRQTGPIYDYELTNIRNIQDSCAAAGNQPECTFTMGSQGAVIEINWHYKCADFTCGGS